MENGAQGVEEERFEKDKVGKVPVTYLNPPAEASSKTAAPVG